MVFSALKDFLRFEASSGVLLFLGAVFAMVIENSAAKSYYDALLYIPVEIRFGEFEIAKPLLLWVNDGLMAIFFFLIGLETKREILKGELSEPGRHGRSRRDLLGGELGRPGGHAGLGDSDRDGYRLCARRADAVGRAHTPYT